ncbi:MAG: hypothetical protein JSW03_04770 [Candidatus Eiseniibacteriota bacterium]|nr:MAG: hypothetical protein JSW03_04770 [Candidatus Eisenbacteria bacterium]
MKAKTIPVMVDDRKDVGDFKMTRVTYFYVESTEPSPDIPIDDRTLGIPMLPLEFSGVLHRPSNKKELFETPDQIEGLFRTVEAHESLYVDSDNIWIPNELFDKTPERGDIYRVPFDLFAMLYPLCRNDASLDAGLSGISEAGIVVSFSEIETTAFARWSEGVVENLRAAYPKSENLKLEWRE